MDPETLIAIGRASIEARRALLAASEAEAKSRPGSGSGNGGVQAKWRKHWHSLGSVALAKMGARDAMIDTLIETSETIK